MAMAVASPLSKRPNSITVFGCTGNAGRGVAYHALKSSAKKPNLRIALSGRNRDKVEAVLRSFRDELRGEGIDTGDAGDVAIIVADASDEPSMLQLAESTDVLISCAGPYGRYGEAAVKACVDGGAHYVDITGEADWVARMINDYGAPAERAGVSLCPFSGYDCVPSELGMWLVGTALATEGRDPTLGRLEMNFRGKGGGLPRGTIETILDGFDGNVPKRKDGDVRFYPKEYQGVAKSALSPLSLLPKYQLGQFTGPNFMSVINVPVLCRSAPTLGFSSDFTISDKSVVSGAPPGLINGYGLFPTLLYITTLAVGGMAIALPPVRGWIRKKIKTYSYNGDPSGKVFLDAQGISSNQKSSAVAKCVFPGDAGIYATGLFATSVAHALHEATATGSDHPRPLTGFHSPVAALSSCRPGLLVGHLRALGADIQVKVVPEGGAAKVVDAAKLRSKL